MFVPRSEEELYDEEVAFVRQTITHRGRIWEGCRPAFESGAYIAPNLARMLREGVIVPTRDPNGGYILARRKLV